ncbi:UNVERIFIED_CONTAM: SH3-domain kinase binding protein 1 [Siphonaria sp. JEL0065]|nr:SH3-domain kinase binding protein 1 [Siphonaria sp. JEL0065]
MANCFPLSAVSVCGSTFKGVQVASVDGKFNDENELNAYVVGMQNDGFNTTANGTTVTGNATAAASVAYGASLLCSQGAAACAAVNFNTNSSFALCAEPCRAAVQTLPFPFLVSASQTCDSLAALQNPLTVPACWAGVDREVLSCGFANVAVACASNANQNSMCCNNSRPVIDVAPFVLSTATISPASPSPSTLSNNNNNDNNNSNSNNSNNQSINSSTNTPNIAAVVGSIVGCVLFMLLLAAIWYYCRSKQNQKIESTPVLSSIRSIPPSSPPAAFNIRESQDMLQTTPTVLFPSSPKHNSSDVEFFRNHSQKINSVDPANLVVPAVAIATVVSSADSPSASTTPVRASEAQNSFDAIRGSGSVSLESHRIVRVIHNYRPNMKDELRLVLGASIAIVKEYPDGWADGIDILTGDRGVLPLSCVTDPQTYLQKQSVLQSNSSSTSGGPPPTVKVTKRKSSLSVQGNANPTSASPTGKPDRTNSTGSNASTTTKMFTVIREYEPLRPDELKLEFGKDVILLKSFEDGWGKGYEPVSGAIGMFPLPYVVRKEEKETVLGEDPDKLAATIQLSTRSSSLSELNESFKAKTATEILEAIGEEAEGDVNGVTSPTAHVLSFDGFRRVKVVHAYSATKDDELELVVGMDVILLKEFKDGPQYTGFPVLTASFSSEAAFDEFLHTVNKNELSSAFTSTFGCQNPAVSTLEYQTSFWCSRAAFEGIQKGCASAAPAGQNSALCAAQCQASLNSVSSVFSDPNGCPAASASIMQARTSLVGMFGTACANFAIVGAACLTGTDAESSTCGFIDPVAACAMPANSALSCCQQFLTPHQSSGTPSQGTQSGSPDATNGTSTGVVIDPNAPPAKSPLNVALISGAVVGGIVVMAACAFVLVTMYRKREAKKAQFDNYMMDKRNNVSNNSNNNRFEFPVGTASQNGADDQPSFSKNAVGPFTENNKTLSGTQKLGSVTPMTASGVKQQHLQHQASTKVVRVVHPYRAVLNDELTLTVGNDVIMTKEHNDGWADGIDPTTGARGVFPITCVMDPEEASKSLFAQKEFRLSTRQSSIYSKSVVGESRPYSSASYNSVSSSTNFQSAAANNAAANANTVYRVLHKYDAALDDELDLIVGNDIIVLQEFDDGWAKGMEPASGSVGLFPMTCVGPAFTGVNTNNSKYSSVYSKRTSSISTKSTQFNKSSSAGGNDTSRATSSLGPTAATTSASKNQVALTGDKSTLTVIHPYEAGDSDELTLVVGRTLVIVEEFDDGWCEGRDIITNKSGIFPLACVARGNNVSSTQRRPESFAKRRSSIRQAPKTVVEKRVKVIHQYNPTQSDELLLDVGAEVVVIKEFNDGWARGKNPTNGKVGMFPLICVQPI